MPKSLSFSQCHFSKSSVTHFRYDFTMRGKSAIFFSNNNSAPIFPGMCSSVSHVTNLSFPVRQIDSPSASRVRTGTTDSRHGFPGWPLGGGGGAGRRGGGGESRGFPPSLAAHLVFPASTRRLDTSTFEGERAPASRWRSSVSETRGAVLRGAE